MSSNARRQEKRQEDDAAYLRRSEERHAKEAEFQRRFGALESRLETLGISPYELAEWFAAKADQ